MSTTMKSASILVTLIGIVGVASMLLIGMAVWGLWSLPMLFLGVAVAGLEVILIRRLIMQHHEHQRMTRSGIPKCPPADAPVLWASSHRPLVTSAG
jgi:hypothetical protein